MRCALHTVCCVMRALIMHGVVRIFLVAHRVDYLLLRCDACCYLSAVRCVRVVAWRVAFVVARCVRLVHGCVYCARL